MLSRIDSVLVFLCLVHRIYNGWGYERDEGNIVRSVVFPLQLVFVIPVKLVRLKSVFVKYPKDKQYKQVENDRCPHFLRLWVEMII